tara:strand:+ start:246 stop:665 length:420 start_codon:yes stop_codon:yes gene_type:complete
LSLPDVEETLFAAKAKDVLELDEVWSFVLLRRNKRWLWTVMCRRTRQIVAFVNGDHSEKTCRALWARVPQAYRKCHSFSDFWKAYAAVLPEETHRSVGKESGETAHMDGALEQHPAPAHRTLRPRGPSPSPRRTGGTIK